MLIEEEERVLLSDLYNPLPEKTLEFRLVYGGLLLGAGKNDTRSTHKHEIRRVFHDQLKVYWTKSANLREWECPNEKTGKRAKVWENAAEHFQLNGIGYVPLSFDGLGVACKLDILMLRPEAPGQTLIKGGDIDNRLKTLFDALRMPKVGEVAESPEDGRNPFFCLLEDDSLINHLSVTTDFLLGEANPNDVRLVITVNMWPVVHTSLNIGIF
jgi:hypothetical protein